MPDVDSEPSALRRENETLRARLSLLEARLAGVETTVTPPPAAGDAFRALAEHSLTGLYIADEGRLAYVNPALARIFGYEPAELIGADSLGVVHPDDRALVAEDILQLFRGETSSLRHEFRGLTRQGETRYIRVLGTTAAISGRRVVIGNLQDITESRRAEHDLLLGEHRFKTLFESIGDAVFVADAQTGMLVDANARALELVGRSRAELLTMHQTQLHPQERGEEVRRAFESAVRLARPGILLETEVRHADGRIIPVEIRTGTALEIDGRPCIIGVFRDATARKQAELAHETSERKYRQLFEAMSSGFALHEVIVDDRGQVVDYVTLEVNPAYETLLGAPREAVIGRRASAILPPDELRHWLSIFGPVAQGGPSAHYEMYSPLNDKHFSGTAYSPQYGQFAAILSDTTESRRAELALRESEARFRSLIESAPMGILMFRGNTVLYANPAVQAISGYASADQLPNGDPLQSFVARQREKVDQEIERLLRGEAATIHLEALGLKPDGAEYPLEIWATQIVLLDGPCILAFVSDTSEKIRLAEQFRQVQKMEAVGRLAGGVAHDFNNLLTVINGYADLMIDCMDSSTPFEEEVKEIRAAGERAAHLTRQLLAFSRHQVLETRVLDLNQVIEGMARMLRRLIGEDIELALRLAPDLTSILADQGQIEQVLLNLAVNARDAMPDVGQLIIETADVRVQEGDRLNATFGSQNPSLAPGRYVALTVSDTGVGMSAEVLDHLFEPFFTTKEVGKGTGLGLATVFGIVKQSGGDIAVSSAPGQGATFRIYLPASTGAAQAGTDRGAERPAYGHETILVLEDDEALRRLIVRVLQGHGYKTIEARNGLEALAVYSRHAGSIALILSDVVMPEMSGPETVERLQQRGYKARVLFMSGYTDRAPGARETWSASDQLIHKPFTSEDLATHIRRVLDRA